MKQDEGVYMFDEHASEVHELGDEAVELFGLFEEEQVTGVDRRPLGAGDMVVQRAVRGLLDARLLKAARPRRNTGELRVEHAALSAVGAHERDRLHGHLCRFGRKDRHRAAGLAQQRDVR